MKSIKLKIKTEHDDIICCCLADCNMRCDGDCDIVWAKLNENQGSEWCMKHNKEVKLRE